MEKDKLVLFGQGDILKTVSERIKELKKGSGSLVLVGGNTGSGKTYFLDYTENELQSSSKEIRVLRVRVSAPIFDFKAGNLEQLKPFINLLQELEKPETKKELYREIAVSSLASMPLIGEFVYPYKEIKRNIDEYNKAKMINSSNLGDTFYEFFFDNLNKKLKNRKVVILIDDFHYSDYKSVSFLSHFIEDTNKSALIIATYNDTFLNNKTAPINSILDEETLRGKFNNLILNPLSAADIRELSKNYFDNYNKSDEFEEWILEKTEGNPSIIIEYLKHFSKMSPFDNYGNLVTNFKENEYLPQTWKALFTQQIEEMSEEDFHILTLCASEGVEFTASIVSKLLSVDVVTAIKKLRNIIKKTNIIKSLGVQLKYGIQTTTYTFNHSYYQTYFKQTLEYEEHLELQSKISELLKIQYVNLSDDDLKQELALQLAAHSIESGDTETAKEALHYAAQSNEDIGGDDFLDGIKSIIEEIDPTAVNLISSIDKLKNLNELANIGDISNIAGIANGGVSDSIIDFKNIKKIVLNDMINDNHLAAINKINHYLSNFSDQFNDEEKIQLRILLSKSYLDTNKPNDAKLSLDEASQLIKSENDPNIIVLLNNAYSAYYYAMNDMENAYNYLHKYENYYQELTSDTKILTFALASQIFKNNANASKFKEEAIKLSAKLNYNDLKNELRSI